MTRLAYKRLVQQAGTRSWAVCCPKQRSLIVQSPILLVSNDAGEAYINELQAEIAVPFVKVASIRAALKALRNQTFCLIMIDSKASHDPARVDLMTRVAGIAPALEVDLMATSVASVLIHARLTMSRFAAEQARARNAAIAHLQGELRDSLSGLLLESQLALREVDASKHPKLVNVVQIAGSLSARLKLEENWQGAVV